MFCFVLRIPHPFSKLAYVNSWPPLGTHCAEVLIITSKLYRPWNIFATLNWQRQSQMKTKKCENTQIQWQTYFYTATTWSMAWQVAQKLRGPRPSTQKWKHSTAQQDNMAGTHKWKWSVPRCQLGHVANTKDTRWTWWKKQGGGVWMVMNRSYLSIQKICWRWGSDRCPFRTLPHAAWFEKSRKEGSLSMCTGQPYTHMYTWKC